MSKRVFLSYRRSDTADQAIALKIVLERKLPQIVVFVDTESINPAERWPDRLTNTLEHSSVVVALIGPRWRFGPDGENHCGQRSAQAHRRHRIRKHRQRASLAEVNKSRRDRPTT